MGSTISRFLTTRPAAKKQIPPATANPSAAPQLAGFANALVDWARKSGEDMPNELAELAHRAQDILTEVKRTG